MSFEGPISNDFLNVGALNRAFLHLLQSDSRARESLRRLPRPIAGDLESLTPLKVDRLSAAPFLLMSFRERDDADRKGVAAGTTVLEPRNVAVGG